MLLRSGLLLAFAIVLLQIAVYLQPLLPEKYHINPVCQLMTHHLIAPSSDQVDTSKPVRETKHHLEFLRHYFSYQHEPIHHAHNHQCQYCKVYSDLVLYPDSAIKTVIDRIQVRFLVFVQRFKHVYFELQRLFLILQGRAPPLSL
ncbi:DUF2946 domain-containing protein [Acinetobacter sp. TSRC1-2]|uniref:DUF2946 domain-containing protein n=1 Tax=unclassified Acinetobacter TaxID=196816 RepID=UPI003CFBBDCC